MWGNDANPGGADAGCKDRREKQLISGIAAGDESAMEAFFCRYRAEVYAFARRRLDDSQSAGDIVSEVMLAVWQGARRFRGESGVRTWLLGIANNKVRDYLRRRGPWHLQQLDRPIPDTGSPGCERMAVDAARRHCLNRCLQALSDEHRQVVHLAFFEDLSYPEIARVIDRPVGTVKTRMYHARIALKRSLKRMGVTDPI